MLDAGKMAPFLAYPLLGVVVGWLSLAVDPARRDGAEGAAPLKSRREREEARAKMAGWRAEDLLKQAREQAEAKDADGYSPFAALLEGWTTEEIRAALDEAAREPGALASEASTAALLLRGYVWRDLDGALAWLEGQPEIIRSSLGNLVAYDWPQERALEGLAYLRAHPEIFPPGAGMASFIVGRCVTAVAAGGPQAVLAFLKEMREEGRDPGGRMSVVKFPPGFDFEKLMTDGEDRLLQPLRPSIYHEWMEQDREGAYRWVIQHGGAIELHSMIAFHRDDPAELAGWFMEKVEQLTPQQRAEVMKQQGNIWTYDLFDGERWISAARSPEMRRELLAAALHGMDRGHTDERLRLLEMLPTVEERLQMLEQAPVRVAAVPPMAQEQQQALRQGLADWGVEPVRLEAIVKHFTGSGK